MGRIEPHSSTSLNVALMSPSRYQLTRVAAAFFRQLAELDAITMADSLWLASVMESAHDHLTGSEGTVDTANPADEPSDLNRHMVADHDPRPRSSIDIEAGESVDVYWPDEVAREDQLGPESTPRLARKMGLPAPRGVRHATEYARELRPLRQLVDAPRGWVLDADGTANASGASNVVTPVFRRATERRYTLHLVIDSAPSMAVWGDALHELLDTLRSSGSFRFVHSWQFECGDDGPIEVRDESQRVLPPSALRGVDGRGLVLVATDLVDHGWRASPAWETVRSWATFMPTAFLDPLPPRLWDHTGAGSDRVIAKQTRESSNNLSLTYRVPAMWRLMDRSLGGETLVPLIALNPGALGAWARLVTNSNSSGCTSIVSFPERTPNAESPDHTESDNDVVNGFLQLASDGALQLALYASFASSTSVGVLTALQHELLASSSPLEVSEVVTSGMFDSETSRTSGETTLRFKPGCRRVLAAMTSDDDARMVYRAMSHSLNRIHRASGADGLLALLLRDEGGDEFIPAGQRAFAQLSRNAYERLVGDVQFAGEASQSTIQEPDRTPPSLSTTVNAQTQMAPELAGVALTSESSNVPIESGAAPRDPSQPGHNSTSDFKQATPAAQLLLRVLTFDPHDSTASPHSARFVEHWLLGHPEVWANSDELTYVAAERSAVPPGSFSDEPLAGAVDRFLSIVERRMDAFEACAADTGVGDKRDVQMHRDRITKLVALLGADRRLLAYFLAWFNHHVRDILSAVFYLSQTADIPSSGPGLRAAVVEWLLGQAAPNWLWNVLEPRSTPSARFQHPFLFLPLRILEYCQHRGGHVPQHELRALFEHDFGLSWQIVIQELNRLASPELGPPAIQMEDPGRGGAISLLPAGAAFLIWTASSCEFLSAMNRRIGPNLGGHNDLVASSDGNRRLDEACDYTLNRLMPSFEVEHPYLHYGFYPTPEEGARLTLFSKYFNLDPHNWPLLTITQSLDEYAIAYDLDRTNVTRIRARAAEMTQRLDLATKAVKLLAEVDRHVGIVGPALETGSLFWELTNLQSGHRLASLPDLGELWSRLAVWLTDRDRNEEALNAAREAIHLFRELTDADANGQSSYADDLARSLCEVGRICLAQSRPEEGLAAVREAILLYESSSRGPDGASSKGRESARLLQEDLIRALDRA